MKGKKEYCDGCYEDYYNHGNASTTGECWLFKKATTVKRLVIGWWIPMDKKENFYSVTTNSCHGEPGKRAFLEKLPSHLR